MGTMGAGATVAIIVLKENEIVEAFRRAGATATAAAAAPTALGVHEHRLFRKLCQRAVLREARPGFFYLDEPSWEAVGRMRRRLGLAILLVVLGAALVTWLQRFGIGAG